MLGENRNFESSFTEFLEQAPDVLRIVYRATAGQTDSDASFEGEIQMPSGEIGFLRPDWVVVQNTEAGEVNWLIKARDCVWENAESKERAIYEWCRRAKVETGAVWNYIKVDQSDFDPSWAPCER